MLSLTNVLVLPIDRWLVEFAPFTTWLAIFLAGMLLALLPRDIRIPGSRFAPLVLAAITIALAAVSWWAWPASGFLPVLVVGSLAGVFLVLLAISRPDAFLGERLQALGPYVLGIYLVHGLAIRSLIVTVGLPVGSLGGLLAIAGVALAASLVVVLIMARFNWTRRMVSIGR